MKEQSEKQKEVSRSIRLAMTQDFSQQRFEFKDWEKAKACWIRNHELYPDILQLVICWDSYSSGYWIEKLGTELSGSSKVYTDHKKILRLFSRVKKEIEVAYTEIRSPRLIL